MINGGEGEKSVIHYFVGEAGDPVLFNRKEKSSLVKMAAYIQ